MTVGPGLFIITGEETKICKALSDAFEQGMTVLDAKGYYSGSDKKVVFIVLNRFQITHMRDLVHAIDPSAYISISEVADVFKANQAQ